jgi:phage shock protein A
VIKAIRRWWRYLGTKLGMTLDEVADPRVQLEQAIDEAREQHRQLTEQAANVIASQTQLQARLDRAIEAYGNANASARQAVRLADDAQAAGSEARAQAMTQAAEGFVSRSIALETEIDSLKRALLEATAASDRARQAVTTSSAALRKRLAEREALLSKLDQAKVQEQMNAAMAQLGSGVGGDVPSLDEVRTKIEHRLAAAQAMTEVGGAGIDMRMLEVEQAQREAETAARLADLRAELGVRVVPPPRAALPEPKPLLTGEG